MKAKGAFCYILFQAMMLSLIVGKLEQAYSKPDGGFNAIWVLFPVFIVTGCILCCCTCLIYCAKGDQFETEKEGDEEAPGTAATRIAQLATIPPISTTVEETAP
jgi:hypothetical protein